ncbi:MAG: type II CRISPR-associated endonuclease Cas1 [Mariprofundaceae bacterium]
MSEHRILHIESPAWVGLDTGRLCIRTKERDDYFTAVEDVAALSLSDPAITVSVQALQSLAAAGAVVLVADSSHLPTALMQPLQANTQTAVRVRQQAEWCLAHPKHAEAIWSEVVAAKLRMQADSLRQRNLNGHLRLFRLANQVKQGDPSNLEAQGARHYWKHIFPDRDFRREKRGAIDHLNSKLNYGYAILRALVARHLALAGLVPSLGIKHRGPVNAFNLADDLMEPFRPLIDGLIYDHLLEKSSLDTEQKRVLLGLMEMNVNMSDGKAYRIHAALDRMVQSLCRIMSDDSTALLVPVSEGDGQE